VIWKRKPKPVWTYVATVRGFTRWTGDSGGEAWSTWLLEERGAERRATFYASGHNAFAMRDCTTSMSPRSALVKIEVDAWLKGGPLPKSRDKGGDDWPPKKPPEDPDPEPPLPPDDGVKKSFIDAVLNGTPEDASAAPKEPAEPAPHERGET
jgi:hypothetical protein